MEREKVAIRDSSEFPDTIDAYIWPKSEETRIYARREYCFIDVILDKDQEAIGSSRCSKCKESVEPFIKFCPYCGAKTKGRRLLRKKEKIDDEQENSPICL